MKKWCVFFVLTFFLCLIPLISAMATTGTVTVSALNVRASASTESQVVGVLHEGDQVTIKETCGSWYKITGGGKSGYASKNYIKVTNSSSSSSSNGTAVISLDFSSVANWPNTAFALLAQALTIWIGFLSLSLLPRIVFPSILRISLACFPQLAWTHSTKRA